MKLIALAAIGGLTALTGCSTAGAYTLTASADTVVTATVLNHPDGGNGTPATWARDTFKITLTIHKTTTGYTLTTIEHGTFATVKCPSCSPHAPGPIARTVTGAFDGVEHGTTTGTLKSAAAIAALDKQKIDDKNAADKAGSAFQSETWFQQFFTNVGAADSPSSADYTFTYKTPDELWTDANTNGDGTATGAGNITGKLSSKLTAASKCRVKGGNQNRWTVSNAQGDRSRPFAYRVSYHGAWSPTAKGTVAPTGSTTVMTATGGYLSVHYYNGYGVSEWTSARSLMKPAAC